MGFSKKTKAAVLAGAMTLGAVSGAYAYFSGTAETKSNVFNIVAGQSDQKDTAGTILEPGWNPANAVDLEPGAGGNKGSVFKIKCGISIMGIFTGGDSGSYCTEEGRSFRSGV